jgi:hypothetical protein
MCNSSAALQSGRLSSSCNFAVASAVKQTESEARTMLLALVKECEHKWLRLFQEPDVWTNLDKRRAMVQARLVYLDAVDLYEQACQGR